MEFRRLYCAYLALLVLTVGACGDEAVAPGSQNSQDVDPDGAEEVVVPVIPDSSHQSNETLSTDENTPVLEGEFKWPCAQNSDCDDEWCVPTPDGNVCSQLCIDDCPEGWACTSIPTLSDPAFICLPVFPHLCEPCNTDLECGSGLGELGDKCISFGDVEGSFCGGNCTGSVQCPLDYGCESVTLGNKTHEQCRPVSGECSCSEQAIQVGASTQCQRSNEHGTCTGTRKCSSDGLSDCSALEPAIEICDGIDNDCDDQIDEQDSEDCNVFFQDLDGDLYGNKEVQKCLCDKEGSFSAVEAGDCDDGSVAQNPGAIETCNGIDDNCNKEVDEADALGCKNYYPDGDDDGWGFEAGEMCLCSPTNEYPIKKMGDCDDGNALIAPGEPEICNGVDDNCNGLKDEEGAQECTVLFLDNDGDGFGVSEQAQCLCAPEAGFKAPVGGDCNDGNKDIFPGAGEICDGVDNDCDTAVDEADAAGCETYFEDSDKDGFGLAGSSQCLCTPAAPFLALQDGDCKDTNDEIHPNAKELCDQVDNDCNQIVDDEGAQGCELFYFDGDGDEYGAPGIETCLCKAKGKWTAKQGGDCNDDDLLIFPGEPCKDPDCEWYFFTSPTICGGDGECNVGGETAPCPGGFLCENGSSCKETCLTHSDCIENNFCISGACTGKKANGSQCLDQSQCQSEHCANGYCCTQGKCCGGDDNHCDDTNLCTSNSCNEQFECQTLNNTLMCAAATCDQNVFTTAKYCTAGACVDGGTQESCVGNDPCKSWTCTLSGCSESNAPKGVLCEVAACNGKTLTTPTLCDGLGECTWGGTTLACPGGYICDNETECLTACKGQDECANNYYCSQGQCIPQKPNGAQCGDHLQCGSGHCGSGFCCDEGICCGGKAVDCDDANVCTSDLCTPNFQCQNAFNSDPCKAGFCDAENWVDAKFCNNGECTLGGDSKSCTGTNLCLINYCGNQGCEVKAAPIGTACADASCLSFTLTAGKSCNGGGECTLGGTQAGCPGGTVCKNLAGCWEGCNNDFQCQSELYCSGGYCAPKKKVGKACSEANECLSMHCNNGYCCASGSCCGADNDCDDEDVCTTESCNAFGQCKTTFNMLECVAGSCDGSSWTAPKSCQSGVCQIGGFQMDCVTANPCLVASCGLQGCKFDDAVAGTPCAAALCGGLGMLTTGKSCNGSGQCNQGGASQPCPGGFGCKSGESCDTGCTQDSQCQWQHFCTVDGLCTPKHEDGETCDGDNNCLSKYCSNGFCCIGGICCDKSGDCDDSNVCTTDTCNPFSICSSSSNNEICASAACDGLNFTAAKTCSNNACQDGGGLQNCSGNDECTVYSCTPDGCKIAHAQLGTACKAASCNGSKLTTVTTCTANGDCSVGGVTGPCAGAFTCKDATSCRSLCTENAHCVSGFFCGAGLCQPKRNDGDACTTKEQCQSEYCSNGYCCAGPTANCCSQSFHCDDSNPCTDDACSVDSKCEFLANTAECSPATCDGLKYTPALYCQNKSCPPAPVPLNCGGFNYCKTYACSTQGCTVGNGQSGIQCSAQLCSGDTLTQAKTCNESGLCNVGGNSVACPGGYLCENSLSCKSSCTGDQDCHPASFCQGTVCQPKRVNGETCSLKESCVSGYCANGYCCLNNGSSPKCCGGSSQHCDDANLCTDDVCQQDFSCGHSFADGKNCQAAKCNGATHTSVKLCSGGACIIGGTSSICSTAVACKAMSCSQSGCQLGNQASGTPCEGSSCTGFTLIGAKSCNGSGDCTAGGTTGSCPGGFICQDTTNCRTSCQSDSHCQANLFCQNTVCISLKSNGEQCTQSSECTSGYCNSGFCCHSGTCCQNNAGCNDSSVCTTDSCSAAFQCEFSNNNAECALGSCNGLVYTHPQTCTGGLCNQGGTTENCAGQNLCVSYLCGPGGCATDNLPAQSQCQAPQCVGATLTQAKSCDGLGGCNSGGTQGPCPGNLSCQSSSTCRVACALDNHCTSGFYCSGGTCVAKQPNGASCTTSNACLSVHCSNNVCCTSGACCTSLSQCNDNNLCSTESCTNFQCQSANNSLLCEAASCDNLAFKAAKYCSDSSCSVGGNSSDCAGTNPCLSYLCSTSGCGSTSANIGTTCGQPVCTGNLLTQSKTCDNLGNCSDGGTVGPCPGNYTCLNSSECRGTCSVDAQCVSGFYCSNGICIAKKADGVGCTNQQQCISDHCSNGYCCQSGICCINVTDCNDTNVCTDDQCVNNICSNPNNGVACDSGNCVGLDFHASKTCVNGGCTGGGAIEICQGSDPCKSYGCTVNGCSSTNQPAGTLCAASTCAGSSLTAAKQCDGVTGCSLGGATGACPGNFICKDSVSCLNQCTSDTQCASDYYCKSNVCLPQKADGGICSINSECQSQYCNNFTCCAGGTCCTSPTACNDGNICTNDNCISSQCSSSANTLQCQSGSCNGLLYSAPRFCQNGTCTAGGVQSDCTGNNNCLSYTCSNTSGCGTTSKAEGNVCQNGNCQSTLYTPPSICNGNGVCLASNNEECNDGSLCNGVENCHAGQGCLAGTPASVCGDNVCHPSCESIATCAGDCQCVPGYVLSTGEVDSWSTASSGALNNISSYPNCSGNSYPGNEYSYEFTAPKSGSVKVKLLNADSQTDILVLKANGNGCDPGSCIAIAQGGGSSVSFAAIQGSTYYVVVDRRLAGSVDYQLYVHYTGSVCHIPFVETWQRTPFPRAWTVESNWQGAQDSPFGATHAKFAGAPLLTNFNRSLTSPPFDTSACTTLKLNLSWRHFHLSGAPVHTGVKMHVEYSTNGGSTWTEVLSYDTGFGDTSTVTESIEVNPLAGSTNAKVRFRVDGDTTANLNRFQIDNVSVAP